jgi:hypothetical protein
MTTWMFNATSINVNIVGPPADSNTERADCPSRQLFDHGGLHEHALHFLHVLPIHQPRPRIPARPASKACGLAVRLQAFHGEVMGQRSVGPAHRASLQ